MERFEQITPKAFANFSPGLERAATTLGYVKQKMLSTLKGLIAHRPNAFSVGPAFY